jgi:hypothetical protein
MVYGILGRPRPANTMAVASRVVEYGGSNPNLTDAMMTTGFGCGRSQGRSVGVMHAHCGSVASCITPCSCRLSDSMEGLSSDPLSPVRGGRSASGLDWIRPTRRESPGALIGCGHVPRRDRSLFARELRLPLYPSIFVLAQPAHFPVSMEVFCNPKWSVVGWSPTLPTQKALRFASPLCALFLLV